MRLLLILAIICLNSAVGAAPSGNSHQISSLPFNEDVDRAVQEDNDDRLHRYERRIPSRRGGWSGNIKRAGRPAIVQRTAHFTFHVFRLGVVATSPLKDLLDYVLSNSLFQDFREAIPHDFERSLNNLRIRILTVDGDLTYEDLSDAMVNLKSLLSNGEESTFFYGNIYDMTGQITGEFEINLDSNFDASSGTSEKRSIPLAPRDQVSEVVVQRTRYNSFHVTRKHDARYPRVVVLALFKSVWGDAALHPGSQLIPRTYERSLDDLTFVIKLTGGILNYKDLAQAMNNFEALLVDNPGSFSNGLSFYGNIYDLGDRPMGWFEIVLRSASLSQLNTPRWIDSHFSSATQERTTQPVTLRSANFSFHVMRGTSYAASAVRGLLESVLFDAETHSSDKLLPLVSRYYSNGLYFYVETTVRRLTYRDLREQVQNMQILLPSSGDQLEIFYGNIFDLQHNQVGTFSMYSAPNVIPL